MGTNQDGLRYQELKANLYMLNPEFVQGRK